MYMILFVLHKAEDVEDVLDAWEAAGVRGATILHSSGLGRYRQAGIRDDIPLMPSLDDFLRHEESFSRTLFSVVEDETVIDRVVAATQKLVGDLSEPDTGLLVVVPVSRAYGVDKRTTET